MPLLAAALLLSRAGSAQADRWYTFENCRLIDNPYNDGDSFHVSYRNRHYVYRLYFVDAPETDQSIPERVQEQAAHWGVEAKQVPAAGRKAARFSKEFLKDGFTVHTQKEDAMGRGARQRHYALVRVGEQYLSEALVQRGLARVYGWRTDLPDGTPGRKFRAHLRVLEREAERERRGLWAGGGDDTPGAEQTIEPGEYRLPKSAAVYSREDPARFLGLLRAGADITVLGPASPSMTRIRFSAGGKEMEGRCRNSELGLR